MNNNLAMCIWVSVISMSIFLKDESGYYLSFVITQITAFASGAIESGDVSRKVSEHARTFGLLSIVSLVYQLGYFIVWNG